MSEQLAYNIVAPKITVLYPSTTRTSDCQYITESCLVQKFLDDTPIVGCVETGLEDEYRNLADRFVHGGNVRTTCS